MEIYKILNLTFTYPRSKHAALSNINLTLRKGEFVTVCGKSGCGKTTLLRLLKPSLSPVGSLEGTIFFAEKPFSETDIKQQVSEIGFVQQNPDNQIVTDKVWHELAFGLESLGYETNEIRTRVAEMASFFGIQTWFYKKTTELSGGQKQLLNLASVMVMQPTVIILDEPTSQLDPIAAHEFLMVLKRINQELGTTVIMTEHRLEEALAVSDRVVVMDNGKIIADTTPSEVGSILKSEKHAMYHALPVPVRVYNALENDGVCPVTVKEGRCWLEKFSASNSVSAVKFSKCNTKENNQTKAIDVKDVWFRYDKDGPDIIKGLNMSVKTGEIYAIVGGNGTGKTTAISLISGLNKPYAGKIYINDKELGKTENIYDGIIGMLPQNPQTLFVKKTVELDLLDVLENTDNNGKTERISEVIKICDLENIRNMHPYDLSGGEQQRVALAKILLKKSSVILMDEPTKGMDAEFKEKFGKILKYLSENSVTVVIVSHDIEFCAKYADVCAMFFDGEITSTGCPREFFCENAFYTTSANRMARNIIPDAVLADDIIVACGGVAEEVEGISEIHISLGKSEKNTDKPRGRNLFSKLFS